MYYAIEHHWVIGEHYEQFEDAYRDDYLPRLADDGDARLLWYGQAPHGGGDAYVDVSVTAFASLAAWSRWSERLRRGDLADWLEGADARRYRCFGRLVADTAWSPLAGASLPAPGPEARSGDVLLRLDTLAITEGTALDAALEALGRTPAGQAQPADEAPLRLVAAFGPALGAVQDAEVAVLYRLGAHETLLTAFDADDGTTDWDGALWPLPAGTRRPETRLLRVAAWSPLA